MDRTTLVYIIFGIVLLVALVIDLSLMSKKNKEISMKAAAIQLIFWIGLSLVFWAFVWIEEGIMPATKYISAYLMEWSLSIDNIFVFILIFASFKIKKSNIGRALLIGILLAIVFRIVFIAVGIGLIDRFHWIMYIFGIFLLYTGLKLFFQKESHDKDPHDGTFYKLIQKILPFTNKEYNGKYLVKEDGKRKLTILSLVVIILGFTDIAFALDSIPTVVSLVKDNANDVFSRVDIMIIYSSNIFAVLGLRSLYFLLRGAANKFSYLQQGIAVVLVFIGVKMLIAYFGIHIPITISLGVIVLCVSLSIFISMLVPKKEHQKQD